MIGITNWTGRMITNFDMMRVWAAATGLLVVAIALGELALGLKLTDTLPMLAAAIAGFELWHFAQDLVLKHRRRRG